MHSPARSPRFTVNWANNRIVLNTTVYCTVHSKISLLAHCVRVSGVTSISLLLRMKHAVVWSNHHSVTEPNPTHSNPWMDPTQVHLCAHTTSRNDERRRFLNHSWAIHLQRLPCSIHRCVDSISDSIRHRRNSSELDVEYVVIVSIYFQRARLVKAKFHYTS